MASVCQREILLGLLLMTGYLQTISCQNALNSLMENDQYPTTTDYYYYYNDFDPTVQFRPGSSYCEDKSKCSDLGLSSYPTKNCYCDKSCSGLNDCCLGNAAEDLDRKAFVPQPDVFSCVSVEEIVLHYHVYIVNKCPQTWIDGETRTLCEARTDADDLLLKLPVSDTGSDITYKNIYCAFCNEFYDFEYWKYQIKCKCYNKTGTDQDNGTGSVEMSKDCGIQFLKPIELSDYRKCPKEPVVDQCNGTASSELVAQCTGGQYSLVFHKDQNLVYRNKYCAICNGISEADIWCEPPEIEPPDPRPSPCTRGGSSFRMLVDFNTGSSKSSTGSQINAAEDEADIFLNCAEDELYDPFANTCREILCIPPRKAKQGKCVLSFPSETVKNHSIDIHPQNCTLAKLEPDEYRLINGSQIFVYSLQKIYSEPDVVFQEADVFICMLNNSTASGYQPAAMFQFDTVEVYLSSIGVLISLVALATNFTVYMIFPQLRNMPGKILICLIASLFVAQLLFLIATAVFDDSSSCFTVAIVMHYSFLAAFCWMNIIALDLWMTFSNQYIAPGSGGKTSKRWILYNVYAWILPLCFVSAAVCLDFVDIGEENDFIKPHYGGMACWISSQYGLILFFAGPLAVFKLFDVVAFIATARHIYVAKQHSAMVRDKNDSSLFWIYLKLSLVMGLTWLFAFVANFADVQALWYLFIIFNTLQGLFICVSFVATRKVIKLIKDKFHQMPGFKTSKSTLEATSTSGSKSGSNQTQLTTVARVETNAV